MFVSSALIPVRRAGVVKLRDVKRTSSPSGVGAATLTFLTGAVTLAFQSTYLGPAQPFHLWLALMLPLYFHSGIRQFSPAERTVLLVFIVYAACLTILTPYARVKAGMQIVKFAAIYPGALVVGAGLGAALSSRRAPLGYRFLAIVLILELCVECVQPPLIYNTLTFGEGQLHGTFKERNWLAVYVLLFSYFVFEYDKPRGLETRRIASLGLMNAATTFFSGSKTVAIGVALILMLRSKVGLRVKAVVAAIGAVSYVYSFASQLSGEQLDVRLEEERGPALSAALALVADNPIGHGFGFVESYFGNLDLVIRGLGEGVASVFCSPIDLVIVAGPMGLLFWVACFLGLSGRFMNLLAPIAALSLFNPLHQSEIVYFFIGLLRAAQLRNEGSERAAASEARQGA